MATTAAPNRKEPFHRVFGDEQATRLIELYKRAEKEIGTKLLRAVLKAGTKKALSVRRLEQELKAVYKMLDELKKAGESASAEMVTASFNGGIAVARKQLKAAGIPLVAEMGGVHEKAMKVYSSMIGDRLADVVTTVGRTTADIYRQLQLDSVLIGTVAGYETINTTIRQMEKTGEAQGLVAFVDRSGKQWNMSTYVEMLARTTVMKIHNEAVKNEFVAHGEDLVIISYHLPTCEMCKPWNGRIVSLTGATKGYPTMTDAEAEGLFHPNCRHAFSLYIPDNPYEGLTEEYLTRAAERINEMDEGEKKLLISQLAKREGLPYNPDNKHGEDIYFADKDEESTFVDAIYPPNRGAFWGSLEKITLKAGALIDRYGGEGGNFFSPYGESFGKRSLPSYQNSRKKYMCYEVLKDEEVLQGQVLPWFNREGRGVQYETSKTVKQLKEAGVLKPRPDKKRREDW